MQKTTLDEKGMRPPHRLTVQSIIFCALVALSTTQAHAINLTLEPQVYLQLKQLKFSQEFTGGSSALQDNSGSLTANIPTLPLSLSMRLDGRYLFQLRYEAALSNPTVESSVPLTRNRTEVDRTDWSFNFIYSLPRQFKILTGYTAGKTELTPTPNNCYQTNAAGCVQNLAYILAGRGIDYTQEYSEDGWYLGAAYSRVFFRTNFYFLLSYAKFDAVYTDNNTGSNDFRFEGDADGFNSMISASRKLGRSLFAHARLRLQILESEGDAVDGIWAGSSYQTTEQITAVEFGLTYQFSSR